MIKLKATVTSKQFPFIDEDLVIVNRKIIRIRGGSITFNVSPLLVTALMKTANQKDVWTDQSSTYKISYYEIKTPVEVIEI